MIIYQCDECKKQRVSTRHRNNKRRSPSGWRIGQLNGREMNFCTEVCMDKFIADMQVYQHDRSVSTALAGRFSTG